LVFVSIYSCNSCTYCTHHTSNSVPASGAYRTGGGLEGPGGAADAVAVVSVVRGQAGWAGREGGGHGQGAAWRGRLGHALLGAAAAAAVVVVVVVAAVAVLELGRRGETKMTFSFLVRRHPSPTSVPSTAQWCVLLSAQQE